MTCAMQPAVLVGIVITTPAHNGFAIQIVLSKYEDNPNKDDKEVNLMMKFEQPVVMMDVVTLKKFLKFYTTKCIYIGKRKSQPIPTSAQARLPANLSILLASVGLCCDADQPTNHGTDNKLF